jgi:hypothetical protein
MNITTFIDQLHSTLMIAAEAGGEESRELAERLTAPLESAARLALLEALSAAAAEITLELAPGSVDVRLRGREPDFVVTLPPAFERAEVTEPSRAAAPSVTPSSLDADEGGTARVTLRLPEHLKTRIDEAASQTGLSVNAWLVRAVAAALDAEGNERGGGRRGPAGQSYTGWVR